MVQAAKMNFDESAISFAVDTGKITIGAREDAESIQKAQKISQSHLSSKETSSSSLEGRISLNSPELVTMNHPAMATENLQAIENEFTRLEANPEPGEVNFLIKVREVIAGILAQLSEISQSDRSQTERTKLAFKEASNDAANLTRKLGNAGLCIAGIGFAVLLSQFGFKNPADREVMKFLSEQCPNIGGMFTSRYQATQKEADALAQLMLAEYNAKTSKTQSESSSKQEIINLLDKVLESMKRAASAG